MAYAKVTNRQSENPAAKCPKLYPNCLLKAGSTANDTNDYHANPLRKTKQAKWQRRTLNFKTGKPV